MVCASLARNAGDAICRASNAVTEIDRLILTAWREKLPVYMELPSDIAYLDIEVPAAPLGSRTSLVPPNHWCRDTVN